MHDAFLVRRGKAARQLRRVVECLASGQRRCSDSFAQRLPFEQFRDDVGRALMQAEVMDREDAGMIQRGCRPGFALETTEAVGVAGNRPGQDLDGDVTAKSGIARPIDLAHATGSKRRRDLVGAEAGTSRRSQNGDAIGSDRTNGRLLTTIWSLVAARGPRHCPTSSRVGLRHPDIHEPFRREGCLVVPTANTIVIMRATTAITWNIRAKPSHATSAPPAIGPSASPMS